MNTPSTRLIGGKFGFPKRFSVPQNRPAFLSTNSIRFFNARSALKFLVNKINPPKVWLPSYLCPAIIQAIDPEKTKIAFYPVNAHLEIPIEQFENNIENNELTPLQKGVDRKSRNLI